MPDLNGQFLWYELMTPDPPAAIAFYTRVLGWGTVDVPIPLMPHTRFTIGETPVAGVRALSARALEAGTPPHWMGYIGTPDVTAAVARAKEFGGYERVAPTFVPGIGRFAVIADPQGARFGLLTRFGQATYDPAPPTARGHVGWRELLATDQAAALRFYTALFEWRPAEAVDLGAAGTYQLFAAGERTLGGMLNKPCPGPSAAWQYYFNAGAIDAASDRVTAAGGRVEHGPMEVPGGQWVVHCADPLGAKFALVGSAPEHATGSSG